MVMARICWCWYLVLTTAVGPSLCCRLSCDLVRPCTLAKQPLPARSCCGGKHAANQSNRLSKITYDLEKPSPTPTRDCPCKKGELRPVWFARAELATGHTSMLSEGIAVGACLSGVAPVPLHSQEQAPGHYIAFRFGDPRSILRAQHILRC
jgi:hypothetical protein